MWQICSFSISIRFHHDTTWIFHPASPACQSEYRPRESWPGFPSAPASVWLTWALADATRVRKRVRRRRPGGWGLREHGGGVLWSFLRRQPSALAPHAHPVPPWSLPNSKEPTSAPWATGCTVACRGCRFILPRRRAHVVAVFPDLVPSRRGVLSFRDPRRDPRSLSPFSCPSASGQRRAWKPAPQVA